MELNSFRVYILPYTIRNKVLYNKRGSGVDAAMITQFNILKKIGWEVRMFVPFGDLHQHMDAVDHYCDIPDNVDVPKYADSKRNDILLKMFSSIAKFKPDVIFSNHFFDAVPYEKLMSMETPVIYMSHAVPGFFSDMRSANLLSKFLYSGHTLIGTTKYHADKTKKYYSHSKTNWTFTHSIKMDDILSPVYIDSPKTAVSGDGCIRHVSAANIQKSTFFIHDHFEKSEVFTTLSYLGGKLDDYVKTGIQKYNHKTKLDVKHTDIIERIKESTAVFVGLAPYDSFTITSVESLSYGVPLIVKGNNGTHPAYEMVEPEFHRYIYIISNTNEMHSKFLEFSKMTLDERQELANSTYRILSEDRFIHKLKRVIVNAIKKFKNRPRTKLSQFIQS